MTHSEGTALRRRILERRIRVLLWVFIVGLAVSGATAIPLRPEMALVMWIVQTGHGWPLWLTAWLETVHGALRDVDARYPFLAYGTDWLAFGHFVIAIAFIGPLRDPVRNVWTLTFGIIACTLVVPYALVFGALRGIPFPWRLIDCSFGVFGFLPLWYCRRAIDELGRLRSAASWEEKQIA